MEPKDLLIRPFRLADDLEEAYRVFISGFYHVYWPLFNEAAPSLGKDFLRICALIGSRSFSAEADGRVVGILLGAAQPKWKYVRAGIAEAIFRFGPKAIFNRYQMSPFARKHLRRLFYGYRPHFFKHPFHFPWAEIILFAVHEDFRHRGLGQKLMDAFLDIVSHKAIPQATVCTDTKMSWKFYPAYGFTRVREFPLTAYKYTHPGEEVSGYIYAIETQADSSRKKGEKT
ncbi:MAG: GNAT family N-acetyltransferase [Deltaproteobacteria bacterium]|nr:MAG: GNAT family N-acetyltransferase [Deltaproteobacteria bacterium]